MRSPPAPAIPGRSAIDGSLWSYCCAPLTWTLFPRCRPTRPSRRSPWAMWPPWRTRAPATRSRP
ncbi:hypothetical protein ACFFX0_01065 [Citricoccus parietis]|uniref:Uncharacterized protein n=1 Tax=Citricoccus parietis TaxID=592307 RepID=A0ABV5FT49_9MICC